MEVSQHQNVVKEYKTPEQFCVMVGVSEGRDG